jgi:hypothetical protein
MRLALVRRLVVLVTVALVIAGCGPGGDDDEASGNGGSVQVPALTDEGVTVPPAPPSPTVRPAPAAGRCPSTHRQEIDLVGTDLQSSLNLMGVTACTDGAGGLWLENAALVPWVIERPVVSPPPPPSTDLQTLLFREALQGMPVRGLVIEPGQAWTFSGDPATLHLSVDGGASATWQLLTAAKSVADGKRQDGWANAVTQGSPWRRVVVECARAAWSAGQAATSAAQQVGQTPTVFVVETIGLGQQTGACGTAVQQVRRTQPAPQALLTAEDLAGQLRRPAVAGVIDESVSWLPKLCGALRQC